MFFLSNVSLESISSSIKNWLSCPHIFKLRQYTRHKHFTSIFCILLAFVLTLLPIQMGDSKTKPHVPIVSSLEQVSADYIDNTLVKATVAYGLTKGVNTVIGMLQRTEFSLGPITLPPGEILASVNDGIDRIASALFAVMGIMLVQKLAVGMVYFVTLKLLLPIGLVLVAITSFKQGFIPEFRRLGFFLIKLALLIAVFFPTPALLGNYINSNYFDSRIEASQKTAEEGIAQLIAESDTNSLLASVKKNSEEKAEAETDGEAPASEQAKRSWSDGAEHIGETEEDSFFHSLSDSISSSAHKVGTAVSDTASKIGQTVSSAVDTLTNIGDILKAKAEALANKADHIIDELFTMLAIFIINVIVLPLFVLALFVAITKSLAPRKSLDVIWKNLPSTHAG